MDVSNRLSASGPRAAPDAVEILPDIFVDLHTVQRIRALLVTLFGVMFLWIINRWVGVRFNRFLDETFLARLATRRSVAPRLTAVSRQLRELHFLDTFVRSQAKVADVLRYATTVLPTGVQVTGLEVELLDRTRTKFHLSVRSAETPPVQALIENLQVVVPGAVLTSQLPTDDDDSTFVIDSDGIPITPASQPVTVTTAPNPAPSRRPWRAYRRLGERS